MLPLAVSLTARQGEVEAVLASFGGFNGPRLSSISSLLSEVRSESQDKSRDDKFSQFSDVCLMKLIPMILRYCALLHDLIKFLTPLRSCNPVFFGVVPQSAAGDISLQLSF